MPLRFKPVVYAKNSTAGIVVYLTLYYNSLKPINPENVAIKADNDMIVVKNFKYDEVIISRQSNTWSRKCVVSIPLTVANSKDIEKITASGNAIVRVSSSNSYKDYKLIQFDKELLKKAEDVMFYIETKYLKPGQKNIF